MKRTLAIDGGATRQGRATRPVGRRSVATLRWVAAVVAALALPPFSAGAASGVADGEPAIRVEVTVDAPLEDVWIAWSTAEGAETFLAPRANIDMRVGGAYELFFNPSDERTSTKGMKVLSYSPPETVSFEWSFPIAEFPELRDRTRVVVQLTAAGPNRTRVLLAHLGWKRGADWDRAYTRAQRSWAEIAERLRSRFATGPIRWNQ